MKKYFLIIALILFFVVPLKFVSAQSSLKMSITPPLIKNNVNPGQIWKSAVKIVNNNKEEINVYVEAVDFKGGTENGTVEFLQEVSSNEEENQHLLSRWIVIDPGPVKIPAQSSKEISFIIDVPEDASPGGHYAAILAGTRPPETEGEGSNIKVSSLLGSLILLNIKGDVKEEGKIRDFSSDKQFYNEAKVKFQVAFKNTGNVHIQPQGEIRVYDMFGKDRGYMTLNHNTEFGNVLPDGIRKWEFDWEGDTGLLGMGRYRAVLILGYGQNGRQTDTREFYFWVLNFKLLAIFGGSFLFILLFFIFLIRIYIKSTIKAAQKQIEAMAPPKTKIVQKKSTTKSADVVNLRRQTKKISEANKISIKKDKKTADFSIWKFFRNFILLVLLSLIILFGFLIYRYLKNDSLTNQEQNELIKTESNEDIASTLDTSHDSSENKEQEFDQEQATTTEEIQKKPLIKKEDIKMVILNGSGTSGKAGEASKVFETAGYKIERLGNAENFDYVKTEIQYKKEFKDFSKAVADMLTVEANLKQNNLLNEDILIIVGKDF